MFKASKCPNCRATDLIRTVKTGDYDRGECMNRRFDRTCELPKEFGPQKAVKLPFGRYRLPDGRTVKGIEAANAALEEEDK